ncbi:MAG: hypothetical protein AB7L09_02375 [Nitrospira sp.]
MFEHLSDDDLTEDEIRQLDEEAALLKEFLSRVGRMYSAKEKLFPVDSVILTIGDFEVDICDGIGTTQYLVDVYLINPVFVHVSDLTVSHDFTTCSGAFWDADATRTIVNELRRTQLLDDMAQIGDVPT